MDTSIIRFPGLGLEFDMPRVAFSVFGHNIYWYGIIIALGFVLAVSYGLKYCRKFGFTPDDLIDMLLVAVPVGVIGARAYFVIFHFDLYQDNFWDVLKIWNGGLAIYGGIIGGLGSAAIVALIKKIKPLAVLDIASIGYFIGQAIGRWGNFVNREAYGERTALPWRMEIYNAAEGMRMSVHPCFLYESLWNALGFVLLHFVSKRRKFDGQVFLLYLAWYGLGRSLIEPLRTDSLYLFNMTWFGEPVRVSQFLAILTCAVAVVLILITARREHDPANMQVSIFEAKLAAEAVSEEVSTEAELPLENMEDNSDDAPDQIAAEDKYIPAESDSDPEEHIETENPATEDDKED